MLWELPGPRQFLDAILDSLERQRHTVVVLPRPVGRARFAMEVKSGLRTRAMVGELTVLQADNNGFSDPFDLIREQLGTRATTIEELMVDADRPSRFLFIDALADPDPSRWHGLFRRAAARTQLLGTSELQLILVQSGHAPADDVFLAVHQWWGLVSQLDIDWVTRRRLAELPPASRAERYWTRSLSRGLAMCDPMLARLLVERSPRTPEELTDLVAGLEMSDRAAAEIDALRDGSDQLRSGSPPTEGPAYRLWMEGLFDWDEERGGLVLTRALAVHGDRERIRQRLWRGQLEVLMPIVENVRLDICAHLARIEGEGWEETLCARAGIDSESGVAGEIGGLARLAKLLGERGHSLPRLVRDAIYPWRDIRNELAHWRPVTFEDVERAVQAWERLGGNARSGRR